ncbi:DUF998 domain-containing protein [Kitasatospora sp. NBC_01250]|uniref:DUF998 domain-containing protein n=1 Tax=unclassified Kitasatospora TaxID=2633591 RepID=UPI002E0FD951|nr:MULTISPECIES: DUF998 domain-containing protein [unclassified Kitasatospora]WSJ71302.1 DUF998 domain-containing protein [Kitasatospora sp. NBC_01302]
MRSVPRWTVISSGVAPVLLVGGWLAAGALQSPGYDPVSDTISALAGTTAAYSWIMTGVLFALGLCHWATAYGLRVVSTPGRVALACGGLASVLVALAPESAAGPSARHSASAAFGVVAMGVWPGLAAQYGRPGPRVLRPLVSNAAMAMTLVIALWFLYALRGHGTAGLAERVLTGFQTLWPLVVVASCLRYAARTAPSGATRDARTESSPGGQRP